MTTNRSLFTLAAPLLAALAWAVATPCLAVDIGADGGINLVASFEVDPDIAESIAPPVSDPLAKQHYCDAFQEFSRALYATTEGTHWIQRVRFFEEAAFRDVRWHYVTAGQSSRASFLKYLKARESGVDGPDPYDPPVKTPASLGGLLNHEFGHFFYGLPDEYVNEGSGGGDTGFCAGSYSVDTGADPNVGSGTSCDEEAFDCGGEACVFVGQCILGDAEPGTDCGADADCGAGGICLGASEDRIDDPDKNRICLHETDLSLATGDESLGVCLMAGGGLRKRWCDGGTTESGDKLAGATHVHTLDDAEDYGVDVEFDLGNAVGLPDGSNGGGDWVAHNCWDDAAEVHIDIAGAHTIGLYPSLDEIEADKGPVPAVTCEWLVDGLGAGTHAVLLVDRSGSMSYQDLSDPPVAAVDLAIDGALYFYNQIDNGDYAGVHVFNTASDWAMSGGVQLAYAEKAADLASIDPVVAEDGTDIGQGILGARLDIEAATGSPLANRNIVLFSDGKSNVGADPYTEAETACDAGINVHTIAYGDADSDSLAQLACGNSWVVGTEEAAGGDFAEPDPLEVKTAVARMQHALAGEDEILERRADLAPLAVSTIEEVSFVVPRGANSLTFTWLANRTCAEHDGPPVVCDPVLNLLTAVEIEDPSGFVHPAKATGDAKAGVFRTVTVGRPRAGTWTARLDKTKPPGLLFLDPAEWDSKVPATRVSWLAFVEHPGLEGIAWTDPRRSPLGMPVGVHAELYYGVVATAITAQARVTHAGSSWGVRLYDDGAHGDGEAGDGHYAGTFNPGGDWRGVTAGGYRVKVRLTSKDGAARGVPDSDFDEDPIEPRPIRRPGTAVVEVETSFRLSSRYSETDDGDANPGILEMSCLPLVRGQSRPGLSATAIGFAFDLDDSRVSLGPDIAISDLTATCLGCPALSEPSALLAFDVAVDPGAELGYRRLRVQRGDEIVESQPACRVCASRACSEIELAQEPLRIGQPVALRVTGAAPGEQVVFASSRAGLGSGPCPPALGGLCLDLAPPVKMMGTAVADELGVARLLVALPPLPSGGEIGTQAVVQRGPGGAGSVKTEPVLAPIEP